MRGTFSNSEPDRYSRRGDVAVNLFRWGSSSIAGHIVLWELVVSLPLLLSLGYEVYTEGDLTVHWAIWMTALCALAGLVLGLGFWSVVVRPLKNRKRL